MSTNRRPSSCRILIVDDDQMFLALVKGFLQDTGHRLDFASDALQATGLAIRDRPNLVLLDIQLPGGDGLTVLKRLKTNTHTRNIPVIIVSASDPGTVSTPVANLGAAAYLSKPVTRADLLATIEQALNPQKGWLPHTRTVSTSAGTRGGIHSPVPPTILSIPRSKAVLSTAPVERTPNFVLMHCRYQVMVR